MQFLIVFYRPLYYNNLTYVLFRYYVFADPKGPKIGNGGATLHVLEQLEQKVPEDD